VSEAWKMINMSTLRVGFWLRESRTPDVLIRLAANYRDICRPVSLVPRVEPEMLIQPENAG